MKPMAFGDIYGQDTIIERIKQYLRAGTITGTYLFTGPQGVGKASVAQAMAAALNCLTDSFDACGECSSCKKISKGVHPDVHMINDLNAEALPEEDEATVEYKSRKLEAPGEEIKIETIRQLQKEINLRPYEGRKKVFIIQEAHTMTQDASHAFLKTLEEPPANSVIILVSAKPALLLNTIISRCKVFKFASLKRDALENILRKFSHLDEERIHYLSFFCEGRIGQALRLKDKDVLAEKNKVIDEFIFSGNAEIADMQKIGREGLRQHLNILAGWFRDVYLVKSGLPQQELINRDRADELYQFARNYCFAELDEIFMVITDSLRYCEQNLNMRLIASNVQVQLKH
ncbi:MAG: DNA polymerase III subunit delta' [Candidatus Omnitrophota bacterium]|jgi:DNA polymerase-3 subunit delta'